MQKIGLDIGLRAHLADFLDRLLHKFRNPFGKILKSIGVVLETADGVAHTIPPGLVSL